MASATEVDFSMKLGHFLGMARPTFVNIGVFEQYPFSFGIKTANFEPYSPSITLRTKK